MSRKMPDAFYRQDWFTIYQRSKFSMGKLAGEYGVPTGWFKRSLRNHGVKADRSRNSRWIWCPKHDLVSLYLSGRSLCELAKLEEISYARVKRWLIKHSIRFRDVKERASAWNKIHSKKERSQRYGRKGGYGFTKEMHKRAAKTFEKSLKRRTSPKELELNKFLKNLGVSSTPQKACGTYNIDLALHPIAVEVTAGTRYPLRRSHERKRMEYLFDQNWCVIFVWVPRDTKISLMCAEKIITLYNLAKGSRSMNRKYWVIGGSGEDLTRNRRYLD